MGTDRNNIVVVATAMSLALVFLLEGCLRPGCGNDGLISDPRRLEHSIMVVNILAGFYPCLQEGLRESSFFHKSN